MKQILIKDIGTKDFNLFYQYLCDLVAEHCYTFEIEDSESFPLDEPVKPACEMERPRLESFYPEGASIKTIQSAFIENIELYNYINALDLYIDDLEARL